MFRNCANLNRPITIQNGVTSVYGMFWNCTKFNQSVTIPASVNASDGLTLLFTNCTNMASNVYIRAKSVSFADRFLQGKNNSKRINIMVPRGSTTNTAVTRKDSYSVVGTPITWTKYTNYCYNSRYNIYIYWNQF